MLTSRNVEFFIKSSVSIISIFITIVCILSGCGKKAPPKPPRQDLPPVVYDLRSSIDGDMLKLTWTICKENENLLSNLTGFIVHRSKISISESNCKKCPIMFKRVADIPIEKNDPKNLAKKAMHYFEALEKGYRYIYKVNVYTYRGVVGRDSNIVDLIY